MANEFKIKKGLIVTGASGGTVVDIQGSQGQLFSVTDDLSGSIFAVSDISGVPIFTINSSSLSTFDGNVLVGSDSSLLLSNNATVSAYAGTDDSLYLNSKGSGIVRVNFGSGSTGGFEVYAGGTNSIFDVSSAGDGTFASGIIANGNITSQTTGGAGLNLRRDDTSISGTNTLGSIAFQGDDPVDGTFNNGAIIFGKADGSWASGSYPGQLLFQTRNTSGSLATALTLAKDQTSTFAAKAYGVAPITSDPDSTIATKGYVQSVITGATIYRGTWQAGISATSTGTTSSSTTLTVSAAILDAAGNTPTLVGAVVTGAGITGTVKVASVTSSTVYVLDTAISATASAYIFSPIYGAPDLSGVTQTSGYYYICSEAGSATPNGAGTEPNTWGVGDWVIWNDDVGSGEWQKVDNSSVLSGVGTGQTVALWEGPSSVTDSETLGNAPITVSGNNTTFAGTITSGNITINGSSRALSVTSSNDEVVSSFTCSGDTISTIGFQSSTSTSDYHVRIGADVNNLVAFTNNTVRMTINSSGNTTFTGNTSALVVVSRDNMFVDAGQFYIGADNASTDNTFRQVVNTSAGSFKLQKRISGTFTDVLGFDNIQNATFAGDVNITQTTDVGVLNTTNLDNGSAVGLSLTYPTSNVVAGDGLAIAIGITGRGRSYIANSNTSNNLDASNLEFYTEGGGVINKVLTLDQNKDATFAGNVGIGTTGIFTNNHILNLSGTGIAIKNDTNGSSNNWSTIKNTATSSGSNLVFQTATGTTVIDSAGNVGIGTSLPTQKLEVIGNVSLGLSSTTTRTALIANTFGYSTAWKTLTLGSTGTNYVTDAVSLCFNVLLNQNSSGSYTGDGSEYFWRNVGSFLTPNSGNNGYNTILNWNSSGKILNLAPYNGITFADSQEATNSGNSIIPPPGRSTSPDPEDYQRSFSTEFKGKTASGSPSTGSSWIGLISMSPYKPTTSGFYTTQLGFGADGTNGDMFIRRGTTTTWGSWDKFLTEGNSGTGPFLPLAGGTMDSGAVISFDVNNSLGQSFVKSGGSLNLIIDSNNNSNTANFIIEKNTQTAGSGDELFRVQEDGNVGINSTAPTHKLDVDGVVRARQGQLIGSNSFTDEAQTAYFTNGTADLNVDIVLPNASLWGYLEVDVTGFYNNQDAHGKLTKIYAMGLNIGGTIFSSESRISDAIGPINANVNLGPIRWDSTTSTYRIRLAHIVSTGNNFSVKISAFTISGKAMSLPNSWSLSSIYTESTAGLTQQYVYYNDRVGIGTSTPSALLDIQGTQGQLFSVTDDLSGSIFAVSDISGVPIFDVNSSGVSYFDGNVGIGESTPNCKLDVKGAVNTTIITASTLGDGGGAANRGLAIRALTDGGEITTAGSSTNMYLDTANNLYLQNAGNTKVTMLASGNVGIGTTSPGAKLEVFGTGNSFRLDSAANGSKEILFRNVGTGTATIKTDGDLKLYTEDAGKNILFNTTGGEKMRIEAGGNVGIGTAYPDKQFSQEIIYYDTGTASQSGTTITGVGTTFTQEMDGKKFIFADGTTTYVTAFTNTTTLTVTTSATVASQSFSIYTPGIYMGRQGVTGNPPQLSIGGSGSGYHNLVIKGDVSNGANSIPSLQIARTQPGVVPTQHEGLILSSSGSSHVFQTSDTKILEFSVYDTNAGSSATAMYISGITNPTTVISELSFGEVVSANANFSGKVNIYDSSQNNESKLNIQTASGAIGSIGFETGAEVTGIISSNTDVMDFRIGDGVGISSHRSVRLSLDYLEVFNSSDASKIKLNANGDSYLNGGEVGINITNPTATLHLNAIASNGVPFKLQAHPSTSVSQMLIYATKAYNSTDAWYNLVCEAGDGSGGQTNTCIIERDGDLRNKNNSYGQISDSRLKENIIDATPKLDDVMKVKVKNFNFIGEDLKQIGVVAQELEEVFPGLVKEDKQPDVNGEEGGVYKSVKYSVLVPILVKAMQEQQEIINNLTTRIEQLEN